jgi:hypothetical protein
MNLTGAVVYVNARDYEGCALVQGCNEDETLTILVEETGTELRVAQDEVGRAAVIEQPEEWIAEQLLEAWEPFLRRVATYTAQWLIRCGRYGEPDAVESIFGHYLNAPELLFRELYGHDR